MYQLPIVLDNGGEVAFHPVPNPSDADIEKLVRSLHKRITSLLLKRGELGGDECEELTALGLCQVAARPRASPGNRAASHWEVMPVGMTLASVGVV